MKNRSPLHPHPHHNHLHRQRPYTGAILLFLSCLATLYVGGRLWQDARGRRGLMHMASSRTEEKRKSVSVEDGMLKVELKELRGRESMLQVQLGEAKKKGFISEIGILSPPLSPSSSASSNSSLTSSSAIPRKRLLAVVGISTMFGMKVRRDSIRSTWMPTGAALQKLEEEFGLVVRFFVGRSPNRGDSSDRLVADENKQSHDFIILEDHEESPNEGARKMKSFFTTAVRRWDADFYIKIDDDVYTNLVQLVSFLQELRDQPRLYFGCMKSGVVVTEANQRWYEPEWVNFGDGKQYPRHATGQLFGLSRDLALYVAINRALLHEYQNEDISVGSWMLGLDVSHLDDRRLCCASPPEEECARRKEEGKACVAVFDWRCSGLCESAKRMNEVHHHCA